ncbi:hypothetical protein JZO70_19925 [Enterococcus sp. 669A]|uniref:HTH marR-type domain-containing protein n=1 Tax=Candidatus Enterococcus moelleringii TaxID=2815325 RepID=A0ABS3LFM7_9ENTE|nr:hypothetical protein [Enterococcus sp. 669A]MBO1308453.1 hypothetical protein [Enterococcus sp. 669A]
MQSNHQLARKIIYTSRQQEAGLQELLKDLDLELIQIEILDYLALHPGTIQKSLKDYFGRTLQNPLVILEKKGLIYRKSALTDIRHKRIFLTKQGENELEKVHNYYDQMEQKVQRSLTFEERTTLFQLLDKVQKGLER